MKINELLDKCGLRLLVLVVTYILLRHARMSTFNHLLATIVITLAVVFLIEQILSARKIKANPETVLRTMSALTLRGDRELVQTLANAGGYKMQGLAFITDKGNLVSSRLASPVSSADIADNFRLAAENKCGKIILYAPNGVSSDARGIIAESPLPIKLVSAAELYVTLEKLRALPTLAKKQKSKTARGVIKLLLAKENARKFLISAAVIFLVSLLIPYSVWYIVLACVNIALAVICLSGFAVRRL